jgi:hypothetical protein
MSALTTLYEILQGNLPIKMLSYNRYSRVSFMILDQDPENFQNEPDSFFECLYEQLMQMATIDDDIKNMKSSMSFSTLVALCGTVSF